jgi:hypothetical protein
MTPDYSAASDAARIVEDHDAYVHERDAAQEVINAYNEKRSVLSPDWVESTLRIYINRRQQQDRYGK